MSKRKPRKRKTARIYYSEPGKPPLWWTVKCSDARASVKINGTLQDALDGQPGTTVGCHLSLCAERNKRAFPHPVLLAAFTKQQAYIVTEVKNGQPYSAVRYTHRLGDLVDLNDTDKDREVVRAKPELVERQFTLYAPYKVHREQRGIPRGKSTGERSPQLLKGALGRAVKAGLIAKPVADALGR